MKKLLIIILILSLLTGLCGCKSRAKQQQGPKGARENVVIADNPKLDEPVRPSSEASEPEPEPDPLPEKRTEGLFEAAKTGKRDEIQTYADYDTLFALQQGQNAEWIFKRILTHMSWEILSSKVDGDKAVVGTKLTNVDMAIVMPQYYRAAAELEFYNALEDEPLGEVELELKYMEIFDGLMEQYKNGRIEKLADINLQKFGDDWTIKPDETLADAMCGGYFTALKSLGETAQFVPPEIPEDPEQSDVPERTDDRGRVFDEDIL